MIGVLFDVDTQKVVGCLTKASDAKALAEANYCPTNAPIEGRHRLEISVMRDAEMMLLDKQAKATLARAVEAYMETLDKGSADYANCDWFINHAMKGDLNG